MKNYVLAIVVLLLCSSAADAQRRYPRGPRRAPAHQSRGYNDNQVRVGITGGLNFSNIIKDDDPNFSTDSRLGPHAGLFIDIPIVSQLSFRPEVFYSQKGYKAATTYGEFSQRSDFIDLPLLLDLHLAPQFHAVVGPQVSFLMSTKNIYQDGFSTTVIETYDNDADGFNKSILSGVVGVGLDLSPNLELRGRYVIDLQKNNMNGTSRYPDFRNQVWQVGLGVKF